MTSAIIAPLITPVAFFDCSGLPPDVLGMMPHGVLYPNKSGNAIFD